MSEKQKMSEEDYNDLEMLLDLEKRAAKLEYRIRVQEIELRIIKEMINKLEPDDFIHDCNDNNHLLN